MAENSVDASLDDVSVKVECVDEDYEYNSSFPTDTESFTAIKTDHSEPDESYGLSTESQRPAQAEGTTQTPICMPLISSPPIINRAQLLNSGANITANTADVQPKKQIAALVKVAAPSSTCTTIKQDVDKACYKLSQEGEQSLFLSVNVEKKLCSYVGSDMGRQFLSKRPDIMEHFFQFCQVLYKAEVDSVTRSDAASQQAKKKPRPKLVPRRPNILAKKTPTPTSQTAIPVIGTGPLMLSAVPMDQVQLGSRNISVQRPKQILPAQAMPEVAKILKTSSTAISNIKSIVPQTVDSGRKRKNYKNQKDVPEEEPPEKQPASPAPVEVPFRMNIKKLNAGATKSTLLTLRQSLESKSGSGPSSSDTPTTADLLPENSSTNTQQDSTPRMVSIINSNASNSTVLQSNSINNGTSSQQTSPNGNSLSYGEVLKKAMMTSLSENLSTLAKQVDLSEEMTPQEFDLSLIKKEPTMTTSDGTQTLDPPVELFSKRIKLSDAPTDIKSLFLNFSAKKVTRTKNSRKKPVKPSRKTDQESEGTSVTSKPYSFRKRTKKKRFGDDYVEDFKEHSNEKERSKSEAMREEDEEDLNDEDDEDFIADGHSEDENEEGEDKDYTQKLKGKSKPEKDDDDEDDDDDDDIDESDLKYFDEKNLEEFFDDHRYTLSKNQRGDFHCTVCLTTFKWSMTYIQHMVEKHEKKLQNMKVHQCVLCEKCFLAGRDLASHCRQVHKLLDCFVCKYCNATFNSGIACNRHMETCQQKTDVMESSEILLFQNDREEERKSYVCSICLKVLRTEDGMAKHMKMHEDDAYLICDMCGIKCTTKQRLSRHKAYRHQTKLGRIPCPNCDRRFMSIWSMYRHNQDVHGCVQVICKECGRYFDTQEQLMEHITNIHPHISQDVCRFSCEDCGKWFDQARYLYVHYKDVHRKQRSVCGFCGKGFSDREEFHNHKKTHDLSVPNTCKICAKTCSTTEDLEKHMHYHMRGRTLHQCETCKEVFIRRQDLIDHIVTHTKTFPFICKECGKGFKNKGKLKVHMVSHVTHRPFQCDICGMAFKMKATLSTHIKRHKELKPFKCEYCPVRFKSVEGSRNHMLHQHIKLEDLKNIKFKVYKCEYCQKLMGQKHMYLRHVRLHTGERPCVCDVCGRSFTMPATLNVHKKTHLARKPHHCDICNFGFIDAHKLGKHFQTFRHKQMVEQRKRVKELADTRARNMGKSLEEADIVNSISVKLEEVDEETLLGESQRTRINLGDEVVVIERNSEDPQGDTSTAERFLQGYADNCGSLSSLVSGSETENPESMTQVLQTADLTNQLLVPKTEDMDA